MGKQRARQRTRQTTRTRSCQKKIRNWAEETLGRRRSWTRSFRDQMTRTISSTRMTPPRERKGLLKNPLKIPVLKKDLEAAPTTRQLPTTSRKSKSREQP